MTQESTASDTATWLMARRSGIGGSDAAALYPDPESKTGTVHPWTSQYTLWARKTGRDEGVAAHPIDTPQLWWGNALEDDVRDAYVEITGREIRPGVTMLRHPELYCMLANTDGTVVDPVRGEGVYEGKSTTHFSRDAWVDGIPLYYQVQVQHYLACTGLQWGSVAVYTAGNRQPFQYGDVERNESFIADLMDRIDRWWTRHVIADVPPAVDGSDSTTEAIGRVYADPDPGQLITLDDDWLATRARLTAIHEESARLKTEESEIKNRLRVALGSAEYGELSDGAGWSFKQQTRKESTRVVKASTFRVLREVKNIERALKKVRK